MKSATPRFPFCMLASMIGILVGLSIQPDNYLLWWLGGGCCALLIRDLAEYFGWKDAVSKCARSAVNFDLPIKASEHWGCGWKELGIRQPICMCARCQADPDSPLNQAKALGIFGAVPTPPTSEKD